MMNADLGCRPAPPVFLAKEPTRAWRAGATLFTEGASDRGIYRITSGIVRLSKNLPDGRRQIVAFAFPGQHVGLATDGRHHHCATAIGEVRAARIDPAESGATAAAWLAAVIEDLEAAHEHITLLGCKRAIERTAAFLCCLFARMNLASDRLTELPIGRADVADFLGLRAETLSRCIMQLRQSGLIATDSAGRIRILDREGLQAVADGTVHPSPIGAADRLFGQPELRLRHSS